MIHGIACKYLRYSGKQLVFPSHNKTEITFRPTLLYRTISIMVSLFVQVGKVGVIIQSKKAVKEEAVMTTKKEGKSCLELPRKTSGS